MKFYMLFNIFLISIVQIVFAFPQNQLPSGAIIVAKDGSGKFNSLIFFIIYKKNFKFKNFLYYFLINLKLKLKFIFFFFFFFLKDSKSCRFIVKIS